MNPAIDPYSYPPTNIVNIVLKLWSVVVIDMNTQSTPASTQTGQSASADSQLPALVPIMGPPAAPPSSPQEAVVEQQSSANSVTGGSAQQQQSDKTATTTQVSPNSLFAIFATSASFASKSFVK